MEKKDIIIISLVAVVLIIRLYQWYNKKKNKGTSGNKKSVIRNRGLSGQPDDYEPYSDKGK